MKKLMIIALALVLVLTAFAGCSSSSDGIVVASKQYTESIVINELYAQLIEAKTDIPVERKLNLGGTSVCIPAMENGEIDLYFEFTGTAYSEIFKQELTPGLTTDDMYQVCADGFTNDYDATFFKPLEFNNTYGLAVKADRQDEFGTTISGLADKDSDIRFGCGHIFYSRVSDGYEGLISTYGLEFADTLQMDTALLYEAAEADELDVIVVFTTDSFLKKYDLTVLEDDKGLFPPYQGAPVVRNEILEKYPELSEVLDTFAGLITNDQMSEMNYQVDVENRAVEEVVAEFLTEQGVV